MPHFVPSGPDAILLHHLLETQRAILATQQRHAREIERLSTQMSNKRRRKGIEDIPQWVMWAWGSLMLLLAYFSPETVDRVGRVMAAFR